MSLIFKRNSKHEVLDYIKTFDEGGVQGITGIVKYTTDKNINSIPCVFKISQTLDKAVENEYLVLSELNKLGLPYFVKTLDMFPLEVSVDFISSKGKANLNYYDENYVMCNVMLCEYIQGMPFGDFKDTYHPSYYNSVILQLLLALQVAQDACHFTHYDLHMNNILIKKLDGHNTVVLIKHKGSYYCIPTFGFMPVIIDMGISYVKSMDGQPLKSSIQCYNYGFQSSVFDPLQDCHHLLLSTFYDPYNNKRDDSSNARVYRSIKSLFKEIPLMKKRGWKVLPHDLMYLLEGTLHRICRDKKDYFAPEVIDILSSLVMVPFTADTMDTPQRERSLRESFLYLFSIQKSFYKFRF